MYPCRLIIDPPASGVWNMAFDEALLNQAADEGLATLRFYQWNPPTLSLGYFQRFAQRDEHAASRGAAIVRRLSGGGALLHDCELTYSACLPSNYPRSRQSTSLYGLVHRALIGVLAEHDVAARLAADSPEWVAAPPIGSEDDQFLCFLRHTADDVVAASRSGPPAWAKIAGSAQRRRRGAVLQHGSLLLAASPLAPELAGVWELCGARLDTHELAQAWADRVAEILKLCLDQTDGQAALPEGALAPLVQKFQSSQWTERC
jgi:lipoyl(octanoyl) transferase